VAQSDERAIDRRQGGLRRHDEAGRQLVDL
jgi:hypothetical protein